MNKNAALYALQEREQMEVDLQYHRQNKSFYYNKLRELNNTIINMRHTHHIYRCELCELKRFRSQLLENIKLIEFNENQILIRLEELAHRDFLHQMNAYMNPPATPAQSKLSISASIFTPQQTTTTLPPQTTTTLPPQMTTTSYSASSSISSSSSSYSPSTSTTEIQEEEEDFEKWVKDTHLRESTTQKEMIRIFFENELKTTPNLRNPKFGESMISTQKNKSNLSKPKSNYRLLSDENEKKLSEKELDFLEKKNTSENFVMEILLRYMKMDKGDPEFATRSHGRTYIPEYDAILYKKAFSTISMLANGLEWLYKENNGEKLWLELDLYSDKYKLAAEFDGLEHHCIPYRYDNFDEARRNNKIPGSIKYSYMTINSVEKTIVKPYMNYSKGSAGMESRLNDIRKDLLCDHMKVSLIRIKSWYWYSENDCYIACETEVVVNQILNQMKNLGLLDEDKIDNLYKECIKDEHKYKSEVNPKEIFLNELKDIEKKAFEKALKTKPRKQTSDANRHKFVYEHRTIKSSSKTDMLIKMETKYMKNITYLINEDLADVQEASDSFSVSNISKTEKTDEKIKNFSEYKQIDSMTKAIEDTINHDLSTNLENKKEIKEAEEKIKEAEEKINYIITKYNPNPLLLELSRLEILYESNISDRNQSEKEKEYRDKEKVEEILKNLSYHSVLNDIELKIEEIEEMEKKKVREEKEEEKEEKDEEKEKDEREEFTNKIEEIRNKIIIKKLVKTKFLYNSNDIYKSINKLKRAKMRLKSFIRFKYNLQPRRGPKGGGNRDDVETARALLKQNQEASKFYGSR